MPPHSLLPVGAWHLTETDLTDDLKSITVPTLVLHGEDDQIVPIADATLKSIELPKNGTRIIGTAC